MFDRDPSVAGVIVHLLPLLLFAVAIGVAIWGIWRFTSRPAVATATANGPLPVRPDTAVEELRIRYARGDVTREEYLTRAGDLGAEIPPTVSPPPQGDPPSEA
jgi:uncharacterized membrane protein